MFQTNVGAMEDEIGRSLICVLNSTIDLRSFKTFRSIAPDFWPFGHLTQIAKLFATEIIHATFTFPGQRVRANGTEYFLPGGTWEELLEYWKENAWCFTKDRDSRAQLHV